MLILCVINFTLLECLLTYVLSSVDKLSKAILLFILITISILVKFRILKVGRLKIQSQVVVSLILRKWSLILYFLFKILARIFFNLFFYQIVRLISVELYLRLVMILLCLVLILSNWHHILVDLLLKFSKIRILIVKLISLIFIKIWLSWLMNLF